MATIDAGAATVVHELGAKPKPSVSPSTSAGYRKGSAPAPPYKQKTGRLTVDELGEFAYKKTPSSTLVASLQLGLQHSIGSLEPKPRRDILMTDFEVVETVDFPGEGSGSTPAHKYKDFTFKTYSPEAFRYFREAFGILAEDYLIALCDRPLREVGNPGASGSLFYLSADDAFIVKTVQKKEAHFLQKLLPGYYLNLTQNKRTLLPKFFGLYRYKCGAANIRIVVMNNLLPSVVHYHEKYDLKGSTYKRKAGSHEVTKTSPTYKDLDFKERHGEGGIALAAEKYDILMKTVERDCKVLESFGIMDYSLLLGVHNVDQAHRDGEVPGSPVDQPDLATGFRDRRVTMPVPSRIELSKNFSIISMEDIPLVLAGEEQAAAQHLVLHYPEGYIQGHMNGDLSIIYMGIIDILQSYRLKKKIEHTMKSFITDGNTVSVHNPSYYARRFQDFVGRDVFRKEKVKIRMRKNSASVQQRGRKPGGHGHPLPRPILRDPRAPHSFRRHPSRDQEHRESKELTRSQSAYSPNSAAGPQRIIRRVRVVSDPVSEVSEEHLAKDPNLPEIPDMEVCVSNPAIAGEQQEPKQPVPTLRETHFEPSHRVNFDSEVIDRDFASHVKGTSTPIDGDSPNMPSEHTQTFDTSDTTADECINSKTADGSSSMEVSSSLTEKTNDRSVAMDGD